MENWVVLLNICEEFKIEIDPNIRNNVINIAIKTNAEDLVAILKPIATTLTKVEAGYCINGKAVYIWEKLEDLFMELNGA